MAATTASFSSRCAECGALINIGDEIVKKIVDDDLLVEGWVHVTHPGLYEAEHDIAYRPPMVVNTLSVRGTRAASGAWTLYRESWRSVELLPVMSEDQVRTHLEREW